ncbi:LysM peptidoglycan-binding domain-containing protein [Saccharopolyspora sp. NPDC002376]
MADCETYTIQRGDTLSEIAQWFGVDMDMLASRNGIQDPNKIYPDQFLYLHPDAHPNVCTPYTVKSGDTLSQIGQRYGVSWQKLAHYNHITNPDLIHPDQTICIPGAA